MTAGHWLLLGFCVSLLAALGFGYMSRHANGSADERLGYAFPALGCWALVALFGAIGFAYAILN